MPDIITVTIPGCNTITFYNEAVTVECPEGQSGDPVTIAAGLYSATTQEEANALALTAAQAQLSCCEDCCSIAQIITPIPDGSEGTEYFFEWTAEGTAPFTWAAEGLPSGLEFIDGILAGVPTEAGDFIFIIRLEDSLGHVCVAIIALHLFSALHHDAGAYYPFELPNQYLDATGNGNDLLPAVSISPVTGVVGDAGSFGAGSIWVVNSASLSFDITDGFSFALWFKRTNIGSGGQIAAQLIQGGALFQLVNNQDFGNPEPERFRWFQTGAGTTPNTDFFSITPSHGVFLFLLATIDPADNKMRLQINDTQFVTSGVAAMANGATAELTIQTTQDHILDEFLYLPRLVTPAEAARLRTGITWPL